MSSILKQFLVLMTAAAMILYGCTADFGETADPENARIEELMTFFFDGWKNSDYDRMLEGCSPEWKKKHEDAKMSLFALLANRTALEVTIEQITEDGTGPDRRAAVLVLMDRNNGKDPAQYRLSVLVTKDPDGNWYVDPESLKSYEVIDEARTKAMNDAIMREQLTAFFEGWKNNDYDRMLEVCSPEWKKAQENARNGLFALLGNRTALEVTIEQITEDRTGTERCVTVVVLTDRNDGRDPVLYKLSVLVTKSPDEYWYVDPESLKSYEGIEEAAAETENDSTTETEAPAR